MHSGLIILDLEFYNSIANMKNLRVVTENTYEKKTLALLFLLPHLQVLDCVHTLL